MRYCLQVPWISSPLIGYRFTSGFNVPGAIVGGKLNGGFRIGSDWQFNFLQAIPWGVGLNLFALVMAWILIAAKEPNQAPATSGTVTPPAEPEAAPVPPVAQL
ncbi:MAG: hypothetical protein NTV51_12280 [Verrucomicrobia bacterium]|nr:hypothetical protein [Verrucomicrobiota bacterium]